MYINSIFVLKISWFCSNTALNYYTCIRNISFVNKREKIQILKKYLEGTKPHDPEVSINKGFDYNILCK